MFKIDPENECELKNIEGRTNDAPAETPQQTDEALELEIARFVSEGGGLGPVLDFAH